MRLTVADAISPSYFVAIAAIELGFFRQEGVDMEFVFSPPNPSRALKDGTVDFFGGSPFTGLRAFPGWRGGTLLCALAQYNYWFLAVRADIKCERGDVSAVKGLRLSASADPGLTMKRLLEEAGIDLQRDNVRIVPSPRRTSPNWAWDGVDAIEQGVSDGYWGNGLRADPGVKRGIAKILLDVRRGDGPPAARHWTFPGPRDHGATRQGATEDRRRGRAGHREDAAGAAGQSAAGREGRATPVSRRGGEPHRVLSLIHI